MEHGAKLACFGPEFSFALIPLPWGIRTLCVKLSSDLRGLGDVCVCWISYHSPCLTDLPARLARMQTFLDAVAVREATVVPHLLGPLPAPPMSDPSRPLSETRSLFVVRSIALRSRRMLPNSGMARRKSAAVSL